MKHCPTCTCEHIKPSPLVINENAPFYPLVLLIEEAAHGSRPR